MKSMAFEGRNGMAAMGKLMSSMRRHPPPKELAGRRVTGVTDYLRDDTGLIPSDALEFRTEGGCKLIIRPSGTEPKLKLYLSARGASEDSALTALAALETAAIGLINPPVT